MFISHNKYIQYFLMKFNLISFAQTTAENALKFTVVVQQKLAHTFVRNILVYQYIQKNNLGTDNANITRLICTYNMNTLNKHLPSRIVAVYNLLCNIACIYTHNHTVLSLHTITIAKLRALQCLLAIKRNKSSPVRHESNRKIAFLKHLSR